MGFRQDIKQDVRGDFSFSQERGKEVIYEAGQAGSQGMNIQCLATILPRPEM